MDVCLEDAVELFIAADLYTLDRLKVKWLAYMMHTRLEETWRGATIVVYVLSVRCFDTLV